MAINSRSKGNKNERVVAKLLKGWTGKEFARTPSSGGLNWKSSHSKGDVVCTTEGHLFPFCVEVKAHKEINFEHLLYLKTPKIDEFWEQCSRDANSAGKAGLLLMRYDRLPKAFFFAVLPTKLWRFIKKSMDPKYFGGEQLVLQKRGITIIPSTSLFLLPYKTLNPLIKTWLKKEKLR